MSTDPAATEQIEALRVYVKAPRDDTLVPRVLVEATALIQARTTGSTVPPEILDLATREVAADLYHRRRVRLGVANFDGPDLTPVRVTRDPMKAAADILAPFIAPGIA